MALAELFQDDASRIPSIAFLRSHFPRPKFPPNGFSVGTGCLIAPRLVLTAGHIVYDAFQGGKATGISITFGGPAGLSTASTEVDFTFEWRNESDAAFAAGNDAALLLSSTDCGVIVLPHPVDRFIPVLRCSTISDTTLTGTLLNVFGFPSHPVAGPLGTAYGASFHVLQGSALPPLAQSIEDIRLSYPVRTVDGLSGAPIYDLDANHSRVVRGIHTSLVNFPDGTTLASALRIDNRVIGLIQHWIAQLGGA
jgi:V8-like Glu-specific endopeptidase